MIEGDAGATVTDATARSGASTLMFAVELLPSLVAVMTAVPTATPDTRPVDETVAIDVALELQVIVRPVSVFPFASFVVAVSCDVFPAVTLALGG